MGMYYFMTGMSKIILETGCHRTRYKIEGVCHVLIFCTDFPTRTSKKYCHGGEQKVF